jgi:hypothetical protein
MEQNYTGPAQDKCMLICISHITHNFCNNFIIKHNKATELGKNTSMNVECKQVEFMPHSEAAVANQVNDFRIKNPDNFLKDLPNVLNDSSKVKRDKLGMI